MKLWILVENIKILFEIFFEEMNKYIERRNYQGAISI